MSEDLFNRWRSLDIAQLENALFQYKTHPPHARAITACGAWDNAPTATRMFLDEPDAAQQGIFAVAQRGDQLMARLRACAVVQSVADFQAKTPDFAAAAQALAAVVAEFRARETAGEARAAPIEAMHGALGDFSAFFAGFNSVLAPSAPPTSAAASPGTGTGLGDAAAAVVEAGGQVIRGAGALLDSLAAGPGEAAAPPPPPAAAPAPGAPPLDPDAPMDARSRGLLALAMRHVQAGAFRGLDRNWGAPIGLALAEALSPFSARLDPDWRDWPEDRKAVALVQAVAAKSRLTVGAIDGRWGALTNEAFQDLVDWRRTGRLPSTIFDTPQQGRDVFPIETEQALAAFYGGFEAPIELWDPASQTMQPNRAEALRYEQEHLVAVDCPWELTVDFLPEATRKTLKVHRKVAHSLGEILAEAFDHYGKEAGIREHNLHLFSGDYVLRSIRGGARPSTHAYGIAIDWWGSANELRRMRGGAKPGSRLENPSIGAPLAGPAYRDWWAIWEKHGWYSLGRHRDCDWMHVQAARI